jgi:hypothetical protein
MKTCLIFLCLLISGGLASGTIQTSTSQDKPMRLYVKSYTEKVAATFQGYDNEPSSYPVPGYGTGYQNMNRMASVTETINYVDGSSGSASCQLNEAENQSWFFPGWEEYGDPGYLGTVTMTGSDSISISSGAGNDYTVVPITRSETTSASYNDTWESGQNSCSSGPTNVNTVGTGMPVTSEYCDVSAPLRDHSSSGTYVDGEGIHTYSYHESYSRTAQTIWKLQTGGKATSKLRNLFQLSAWATRWDSVRANDGDGPLLYFFLSCATVELHTYYSPFDTPYYSAADSSWLPNAPIPTQSICIGSYGNLNTNGTKYLILPDNADVDVTPFVAGVEYYTFGLNQPQKYQSYFDLYIQQANPGYSLIFYSLTNDVGHAFWRFRTDAPADALQYISTNLTDFLGNKWGFYPNNTTNFFTDPGILQNDNSHSYNIARSFYIGFPDLLQGLIFTSETSVAPPVYSLSGYNCVSAAREAGFRADVFGLPWDTSPQNFGVTIVEMYPAPGEIIGPFIDTTDIFYSAAPY